LKTSVTVETGEDRRPHISPPPASDADCQPAAHRDLTEDERAALDAVNRDAHDLTVASIGELFVRVALRYPETPAVRDGSDGLTYRELLLAAIAQARRLYDAGVRPEDRVLLALPRCVAETVAVVGTILAGAAYVGLDVNAPTAYIEKIVGRARPSAMLIESGCHHAPSSFGEVPVVETWRTGWDLDTVEVPRRPPASDPTRPAYVAFTSGSTGEPKGVVVPHRAVTRLVQPNNYLRLGWRDGMLRLAPLAFDASTLEIWGALLSGATLEVYSPEILSPARLSAFLAARRVSVAWLSAGLFRLISERAPEAFGGLRQLLTGGDVVPHPQVERMLRLHPGLVITNGYGPTENTTFTTTYSAVRPEDAAGALPIGTPVPGTRVHVLDERGRHVPPGAVGELYVSGDGLADGYLNDPEETRGRFGYLSPEIPERLYRTGDLVRIDERGRLNFVGRRDDQVKIDGYRVEPSAISRSMLAHPEVADAIVVVGERHGPGKVLALGIVARAGSSLDLQDARRFLRQKLPAFMVPALWARLAEIPLTPNGKVDTAAILSAAMPLPSAGDG
jgi:amino acid adenylation domain-containing protein